MFVAKSFVLGCHLHALLFPLSKLQMSCAADLAASMNTDKHNSSGSVSEQLTAAGEVGADAGFRSYVKLSAASMALKYSQSKDWEI